MGRKAIFFDRDGTLLVEMGYISHPTLAVPYAFSAEAVKLAREHGFLVFVVTNQSGIARGWLAEDQLNAIHDRMVSSLAAHGASIDGIYYCPHHPEGTVEQYRAACNCRKPAAELGRRAAAQHDIDLSRSFVIGDKISDIGFGKALGASSSLVRTGFGRASEEVARISGITPDHVADDVLEAVRWAVRRDGERG